MRRAREVRHCFLEQPYCRQLRGMQRMIEVVGAKELGLLHADRRKHGYRFNSLRSDVRYIQHDSPAHAEPEQIRALNAERVHQLDDVARVCSN